MTLLKHLLSYFQPEYGGAGLYGRRPVADNSDSGVPMGELLDVEQECVWDDRFERGLLPRDSLAQL